MVSQACSVTRGATQDDFSGQPPASPRPSFTAPMPPHATQRTMCKLFLTPPKRKQHPEISEIWVMPVELQIAVSRASLIPQKKKSRRYQHQRKAMHSPHSAHQVTNSNTKAKTTISKHEKNVHRNHPTLQVMTC